MTRILLVITTLALVATTAFAGVTISLEDIGEGDNDHIRQVRVSYDANEAIRAFGLDLYTTGGGNIIEIADYNKGDENGYGIFPGRFREAGIDPADPNWETENYNPTAAGGDPDRQPGLGYYGITVELGSLYTTGNEPPLAGTLFTIDVNLVDSNGNEIDDCNLCVTMNTTRGGVVNEDAEEVTVTLPPGGDGAPADCIKVAAETGCFPSDHPDYAEWISVGSPSCWCYPRQCHGDADNIKQGGLITGYMYVSTNDLSILLEGWQVKEPPKGTGLSGDQICADFAHDKQGGLITGYMRVSTNDLTELLKYWQVKEPPKGTGVPSDCLDVP